MDILRNLSCPHCKNIGCLDIWDNSEFYNTIKKDVNLFDDYGIMPSGHTENPIPVIMKCKNCEKKVEIRLCFWDSEGTFYETETMKIID